jgi:hypothetical protein
MQREEITKIVSDLMESQNKQINNQLTNFMYSIKDFMTTEMNSVKSEMNSVKSEMNSVKSEMNSVKSEMNSVKEKVNSIDEKVSSILNFEENWATKLSLINFYIHDKKDNQLGGGFILEKNKTLFFITCLHVLKILVKNEDKTIYLLNKHIYNGIDYEIKDVSFFFSEENDLAVMQLNPKLYDDYKQFALDYNSTCPGKIGHKLLVFSDDHEIKMTVGHFNGQGNFFSVGTLQIEDGMSGLPIANSVGIIGLVNASIKGCLSNQNSDNKIDDENDDEIDDEIDDYKLQEVVHRNKYCKIIPIKIVWNAIDCIFSGMLSFWD